ncbi:hypothetical protein E4T56_gene6941 [Termitomyces sp. T112]|nr:hypothetical protein E4T56_gene6941 [Termitomyces sp. T112]
MAINIIPLPQDPPSGRQPQVSQYHVLTGTLNKWVAYFSLPDPYATMVVNPIAENVLGTMGTICWSGQLIPQLWKSWREKSTTGLSPYFVLLWGLAGLPLGVYAILQNLSVPLIVQPQLFSFLCLFSWGQCFHYGSRKTSLVALLVTGGVMIFVGGLETAIVFAVRSSNNHAAINFFGIFASVMLACGLLPQYYEIVKYKEVIGISIPFITIDWLGAIFALVALLCRPKFDVKAGVAYSLVIVMDAIIILAAIVLNPLARRRRRRELEAEGGSVVSPVMARAKCPEISPKKETFPSIEPVPLENVLMSDNPNRSLN